VGEAPAVDADPAEEKQYQQTLAQFTARNNVYQGLDTQLFLAATWQSPRFLEARVQRRARFLSLPADQAAEALWLERERLNGVTEFLLGVHASDPKLDTFDRPDSPWRLALAVAGDERPPLEVKRVGKATAELRAYYPYLDDFWVAYTVRFEGAIEPGQTATLKVASSAGQASLSFRSE
jgi:hypothetical protein